MEKEAIYKRLLEKHNNFVDKTNLFKVYLKNEKPKINDTIEQKYGDLTEEYNNLQVMKN